jgi:hypothetical protein
MERWRLDGWLDLKLMYDDYIYFLRWLMGNDVGPWVSVSICT